MRYRHVATHNRADYCGDCGARHTPAFRRSFLRRCAELTIGQVRERLGTMAEHLWPEGVAGERALYRDLRAARGYSRAWDLDAAQERLATALRLMERGTTAEKAAALAHVDVKRLYAALRAQGLKFRNALRADERGWVAG